MSSGVSWTSSGCRTKTTMETLKMMTEISSSDQLIQSDEIPRVSNLSEKEFHDEYFLKARPDQHLFSLFSGLFPDPSWHHSPSVTSDQPLHPGPETSEVTRAGGQLIILRSLVTSEQSEWPQWRTRSKHPPSEFLSTFKNMSDSELFPELGALQWFSIRRHVNNEAAAKLGLGGR